MLSLTVVERGDVKLKVMLFMHNFKDVSSGLRPQIDAIYAASNAILSSTRMKKLFEVILGNFCPSDGWPLCLHAYLVSLLQPSVTILTAPRGVGLLGSSSALWKE